MLIAVTVVAFLLVCSTKASANDTHISINTDASNVVRSDTPSFVHYQYAVTFDNVPDHITVEVIGPDGTKVVPNKYIEIRDASGSSIGSGEIPITANSSLGYHTVRVTYYGFDNDMHVWKTQSSQIFTVIEPVVEPPEDATPTITTVTEPATANTPVLLDSQSVSVQPLQITVRRWHPSSRDTKLMVQVTNTNSRTTKTALLATVCMTLSRGQTNVLNRQRGKQPRTSCFRPRRVRAGFGCAFPGVVRFTQRTAVSRPIIFRLYTAGKLTQTVRYIAG